MKELKVIEDGETIVFIGLQDIPGVALNAVGRKPTWESGGEFCKILATLAEALGGGDAARGRAVYALWLSSRDEDVTPALELPECKAVQLSVINSPFGGYWELDLRGWADNWYRQGWSLYDYFHLYPHLREAGFSPETCRILQDLTTTRDELDRIRYMIQGRNVTEEEVIDLLVTGPWSEEVKANYCKLPSGRVFLNFFQDKIDQRYWNGSGDDLSLLKAGVNIRDILEWGGVNHKALTNKELGKLEFLTLTQRGNFESVFNILRNLILKVSPYPWAGYTKDPLVWKWCLRHRNQLSKTRIVHGPGGQVAVVPAHAMVKYVDSDILPRGEFTGWKYVEAAVEAEVKREIADQLAEDRPLPEFPFDLNDDRITQIKTTHGIRDEGVRLNHCVGGYIAACDKRRAYIFHVDDGTELGATVEVCPPGDIWTIPQAVNYGNRRSDKAYKIMDEALAEALSKTSAKSA